MQKIPGNIIQAFRGRKPDLCAQLKSKGHMPFHTVLNLIKYMYDNACHFIY